MKALLFSRKLLYVLVITLGAIALKFVGLEQAVITYITVIGSGALGGQVIKDLVTNTNTRNPKNTNNIHQEMEQGD